MSATSPRALSISGDKGWIFIKQLVGQLAMCACRQSPTGIPTDLETVLNKFGVAIISTERFDSNEMAEFSFPELEEFIRPLMMEIPELTRWNLSAFEIEQGFTDPNDPKRPIQFSFSSRYDKPKAEYDFIDLDALIRNVASECVGESVSSQLDENPTPIDMLIFCPNCHKQHIDRPDEVCGSKVFETTCRRKKHHTGPCSTADEKAAWTNPVHKSHTCRTDDGGCGIIFRVADVPTNGVIKLRSMGSADTWLPEGVSADQYNTGGGA